MTDYLVTVCASCLTASCWHGEFMCGNSRTANVIDKRASELRELGREHSSNYSRKKLLKVCGEVREVEESPDGNEA